MKYLMRLILIIFMLFQGQVFAKSFDVLVLPVDLMNKKQNYYGFDDVSEIVADDVIANFGNTSYVNSINLYDVRAKLAMNQSLNSKLGQALVKYKTSGYIDYDVLKDASKEFKCNSILLINTYAISNKNGIKRSVWDVYDLLNACKVDYPFYITTNVVLLDNVNDIVMWSNTYSKSMLGEGKMVSIKNYIDADKYFENIKMYSSDIISKDISQNVILRFFPKTIRPVDNKLDIKESGEMLRFEKNIPVNPKQENQNFNNDSNNKDFYGEMILGI